MTARIASSPYAGVYALARRLAAGTHGRYEVAARIQAFLGSGFTYDTNPPPATYPLVSFLLATHEGYCQQFSGAMTLMLRMDGIPARVAAGFLPGARIAPGEYAVSASDAHAWVEVFFAGIGWVPFDPTPPQPGSLSRCRRRHAADTGRAGRRARRRTAQAERLPAPPAHARRPRPRTPERGSHALPAAHRGALWRRRSSPGVWRARRRAGPSAIAPASRPSQSSPPRWSASASPSLRAPPSWTSSASSSAPTAAPRPPTCAGCASCATARARAAGPSRAPAQGAAGRAHRRPGALTRAARPAGDSTARTPAPGRGGGEPAR